MDEPINPQQTFSGISGGGELSLYQYFTASPLFAGFVNFEGPDRKIFLTEYTGMSLPLKNFLASTETATTLASLGLSFQLEDSQISKIASTLREFAIGKIFIKDLPIIISSKLGIDDIKAGEITNNVISKLFGPILEDIKRIQRTKFPDKIAQLQKEAQPAGLTRPGVPNLPPIRPDTAKPPAPSPIVPQPQQPQVSQPLRPPLQMPPKVEAVKPELSPTNPSPSLPPIPSVTQAKPQFKMPPDLGSLDLAKKSGEEFGQKTITDSKSLESELEKIASVIDLRNKAEEKTTGEK